MAGTLPQGQSAGDCLSFVEKLNDQSSHEEPVSTLELIPDSKDNNTSMFLGACFFFSSLNQSLLQSCLVDISLTSL